MLKESWVGNMLKSKDNGIVIAENSEEAFWEKMRTNTEGAIEQAKHEIIINEEVNKLAVRKLKDFSKA